MSSVLTEPTYTDVIRVDNLGKCFRKHLHREGIMGSFADLFRRNYGETKAVDGISFTVSEGELLGYIGANGAGKSTSIKMLTGILKPTFGEVSVLGYHPFTHRKRYAKRIGVVFGQRTQLWWDIAVIESFKLLGEIYEVEQKVFRKRLDDLVELFNLAEFLSTPVRKLSLGTRMRCELVASLLHAPKVLFLDEPTIGLDAVGKDAIRRFLKEINKLYSTTIILTTHDLKEIEALCSRVMIIDKGKLIYDGSLQAIKSFSGLKKRMTIYFAARDTGEVDTSGFDIAGIATTTEVECLESRVRIALGEFRDKVCVEKIEGSMVVLAYEQDTTPTVDIIRSFLGSENITDISIEEPTIEEVVMKIYRGA